MTKTPLGSLRGPIELLLVEDNIGDVMLMREACAYSTTPINLRVAEDGRVALSMLRRNGQHIDCPRPDLVLLDLNPPNMDGREVLSAIKSADDLPPRTIRDELKVQWVGGDARRSGATSPDHSLPHKYPGLGFVAVPEACQRYSVLRGAP
jgi:hypothetical protein